MPRRCSPPWSRPSPPRPRASTSRRSPFLPPWAPGFRLYWPMWTRLWPPRRPEEIVKKRSDKEKEVEKLQSALASLSTVILSTFQGIKVGEDTRLRRAVEAAGGKYEVVKNTLAERAGAGTPAENLLKNLSGTNSIAYTQTDPVALAKALTKVAKDVPSFKFRSGIVEGRVINITEIQQLANLPSKEELISKLMFLLNAPAQRIAIALNALPRNLAVTVNEAIKANKFSE